MHLIVSHACQQGIGLALNLGDRCLDQQRLDAFLAEGDGELIKATLPLSRGVTSSLQGLKIKRGLPGGLQCALMRAKLLPGNAELFPLVCQGCFDLLHLLERRTIALQILPDALQPIALRFQITLPELQLLGTVCQILLCYTDTLTGLLKLTLLAIPVLKCLECLTGCLICLSAIAKPAQLL